MSSDSSFRAFDQVEGQLGELQDALDALTERVTTNETGLNSYTDAGPAFNPPAPADLETAIQRLATAVSGLLGTSIP